MKHFTTFLLLLSTFSSFSQIWKESLDTLDYLDKLTTERQVGIKSYTVSCFDENDSIVDYEFRAFDTGGRLIKNLISMTPNQHTDTSYYFYLNDVVQYNRGKREYLYNEKNRLIEIRNALEDTTESVYYDYNNNLLVEIRYSKQNWTTFQYDFNGKILRKEEFKDEKLKTFFDYEHPNDNTLIYYENCFNSKIEESQKPCEATEGHYDQNKNLLKIIKRHAFNEFDRISEITYEYDNQGRVLKVKITDSGIPDITVSIVYTRNKRGDIERIDYFENKKRYRHDVYNYAYY